MSAAGVFDEDWTEATGASLLLRIAALLERALPEPLAAVKGLLTRAERALVIAWLKPLEIATRLFIQTCALALPKAPEPEESRTLQVWGRDDFARDWRAPKPEEWTLRVPGFRVLTTGSGAGSGALGYGGDPPERSDPDQLHPSWPLAERLDAVRRAIDDPDPLIRRTALAMKRNADAIPPAPKPAGRRTISEFARPYLDAEAQEHLARWGHAPPPPRVTAFDTG